MFCKEVGEVGSRQVDLNEVTIRSQAMLDQEEAISYERGISQKRPVKSD